MRYTLLLISLPALMSSVCAVDAQTIDTGPGTGGGFSIYEGQPLHGQTFTALGTGPETYLTSLSFGMGASSTLTFRVAIADWIAPPGSPGGTEAAVIGERLFESSIQTFLPGPGSTHFFFSFVSPLALTTGESYVALFDFRDAGEITRGYSRFADGGDTYAGGGAIVLVSSQVHASVSDNAFTATFVPTVVPEPDSFFLLGSGLAAIALAGVRRRKSRP